MPPVIYCVIFLQAAALKLSEHHLADVRKSFLSYLNHTTDPKTFLGIERFSYSCLMGTQLFNGEPPYSGLCS